MDAAATTMSFFDKVRLCQLLESIISSRTHTNIQPTIEDYLTISLAQSQWLNEILETIRKACKDNDIDSVSISNFMELYEYLLASVEHQPSGTMAYFLAECYLLLQDLNQQLSAKIENLKLELQELKTYNRQLKVELADLKKVKVKKQLALLDGIFTILGR